MSIKVNLVILRILKSVQACAIGDICIHKLDFNAIAFIGFKAIQKYLVLHKIKLGFFSVDFDSGDLLPVKVEEYFLALSEFGLDN